MAAVCGEEHGKSMAILRKDVIFSQYSINENILPSDTESELGNERPWVPPRKLSLCGNLERKPVDLAESTCQDG